MKNTLHRWRATWNPDMYHGWGHNRSYFEGWYFKIVDATEGYAFAFIPGIAMGKDGKSHAFIQTIDGKKCNTTYQHFDISDFKPNNKFFHLQIADNQFSTKHIKVNLSNIQGELHFENITSWPKMLGAPGIMGWYSFVPFMQCYHGVVSLNHTIKGSLNIHGKNIDFTDGRGYIEKDWGVSFPKGYIWMQTNHFINKLSSDTDNQSSALKHNLEYSLIVSVANIPWLGSSFIGYIVGFWFQNKLYRFATYTGAKMIALMEGNIIRLAFKDAVYRLEIEAAMDSRTGTLIAPIQGEMVGKVNESLQSIIHVRFFEKNKLLFEGSGRNAGLEAAGDVDIILTDQWRR